MSTVSSSCGLRTTSCLRREGCDHLEAPEFVEVDSSDRVETLSRIARFGNPDLFDEPREKVVALLFVLFDVMLGDLTRAAWSIAAVLFLLDGRESFCCLPPPLDERDLSEDRLDTGLSGPTMSLSSSLCSMPLGAR
jgi:hypothetical protein